MFFSEISLSHQTVVRWNEENKKIYWEKKKKLESKAANLKFYALVIV